MADGPAAFVCGHPIAHSRSPKIHRYWLDRYRISGSYRAVDVAPRDFPAFLAGLREEGYAGGNITLPHKEQACSWVGKLDAAAASIGAVNTLWFEEGGWCGGNTDAHGFAANLDERAPDWESGRVAVVLGAGGAARAVIHALQLRNFDAIRIVNRTLPRANQLCDRFGRGTSAHGLEDLGELLPDATLLVNTTSQGMDGHAPPPADPTLLPQDAIVADLVYVPLRTPLLEAAKQRGLETVDGLGMLLHQAVPGFERWFGTRPEVTPELRALIESDLSS